MGVLNNIRGSSLTLLCIGCRGDTPPPERELWTNKSYYAGTIMESSNLEKSARAGCCIGTLRLLCGNRCGISARASYAANNQMFGYAYDAAGNLLSDRAANVMTWDAESRMSSVAGATYIYYLRRGGQPGREAGPTVEWK
jgi:hypothetical protein